MKPYKNPIEYNEILGLRPTNLYYETNKKFSRLPMLQQEVYDKLSANVQESNVIIIESATGSGKSIGIIPMLLRMYDYNVRILMSQPTTVNIKSLAEQIAAQTGLTIGKNIGYQYSEGHIESPDDLVYIVTDYFLMKLMGSKSDRTFGIVIIDEVHQRKINMDMFMAIAKRDMTNHERGDSSCYKLFLLSATIDVQKIIKYYSSFKVFHMFIPGVSYPVTRIYKPRADVIQLITQVKGDTLVFISCVSEGIKLSDKLRKIDTSSTIFIDILHRGSLNKSYITGRPEDTYIKDGYKRRVIFATNIAETGITIPGIEIVIDNGLRNAVSYDIKKDAKVQKISKISKASSIQRCGRAGRTNPGTCYCLYSDEEFTNDFPNYQSPEILEQPLYETLLSIIDFSGDVRESQWIFNNMIDIPGDISAAVDELNRLGIIEFGKLSKIGELVIQLGIGFRDGCAVIEAFRRQLYKYVIPIVAFGDIEKLIDPKNISLINDLKNRWGFPITTYKLFRYFYDSFLSKNLPETSEFHERLKEWAMKNQIDPAQLIEKYNTLIKINKKLNEFKDKLFFEKRVHEESDLEIENRIVGLFHYIYQNNIAVLTNGVYYRKIPITDVIQNIGPLKNKFISAINIKLIGFTDLIIGQYRTIIVCPFVLLS